VTASGLDHKKARRVREAIERAMTKETGDSIHE
jgi:hypothetical protein